MPQSANQNAEVDSASPPADGDAIRHVVVLALEQAIDAVVLIDGTNAITFFNRAAEQLWGYDRAEVLGHNVKCLVPRSIRAEHDGYIASNRETGISKIVGTSREILIERKDGSRSWGIFSLSKVIVGGSAHYMALARDISAEVRRREENELLSLVVNETDRVVIVLDADRRIVHVNRAFTELFGYDLDEVRGRLPSELLVSANTDPDALDHLRRNAWTPKAFQTEILAADKSGREIWIAPAINPVLDCDGNVRNVVVVLEDITERRQIESLQRSLLEALASGLTLKEVMDALCRRVEAIAPEIVSTVVAIDASGCLRPLASPSLPASYGAVLDGVAAAEGAGSCGTAAWRGTSVLVTDIATDPLWASYRDVILPLGLRACWSSPIKRRDQSVAGTFAFYFREPRGPSPFHRKIVDACLHLCLVAIEHEENRQQIARLVHFDTLTGLPNRTHMHERIDTLLAGPDKDNLAILLLDIDHFKDFNDALGHPAGDELIIEVANRLDRLSERRWVVGRIDGDTFAMVIPRCNVQRASATAEEILRDLRRPFDLAGLSAGIGASIGISLCPKDGTDSKELVKSADLALHRSKASGRAQYTFFSSEMNKIATERLILAERLRSAISKSALQLHYQPQVSLADGALHGVEALARWRDPELGDVSPGKFIPLAEEIGEVEAIGRWSLREACRQLAAWRSAGLDVPRMSVNLSAQHFRSQDLAKLISGLLAEFHLSAPCLTLEITETAMMDAGPENLATIARLRALGIGLSMDDFGTGFSSLASLSQLPVTELKIDRGFMQNCQKDATGIAVLTAAIRIGQSLGLTVVAEGVETREQRRLLGALGCDVIQGFLLSPAMPASKLAAWSSAWRLEGLAQPADSGAPAGGP